MKKFDVKSFVAGTIIGTLGITTAFAATGIPSATLSQTTITLNGEALPLNLPLISVTMDDGQNEDLYAPATELLEKLGYSVHYDSGTNTVNINPGSRHEVIGDNVSEGNAVIHLANHANQANIAESGSFQAEDNQTLTLNITSDIKGGSVVLFLFDPNGKEQRITIGSANLAKEIPLEKGIWQYNCSGAFKDGGNIEIVGTIK